MTPLRGSLTLQGDRMIVTELATMKEPIEYEYLRGGPDTYGRSFNSDMRIYSEHLKSLRSFEAIGFPSSSVGSEVEYELKSCSCKIGDDCPYTKGKWFSGCKIAYPIPATAPIGKPGESDEYMPYGDEWKTEMNKLMKRQIINLFAETATELRKENTFLRSRQPFPATGTGVDLVELGKKVDAALSEESVREYLKSHPEIVSHPQQTGTQGDEEVSLKDFVVITDHQTGPEVWTRSRYEKYISDVIEVGGCPAVHLITDFNENDSLLASSPHPSDGREESVNDDKGLGMCKRCNKEFAVKDYNGHQYYCCQHCYDKLSDEFDEDYK